MRLRIALTVGLIGAIGFGWAQPVTRLWMKTTSLPSTDNYEDLVLDGDGNSFVCGSSIFNGKYAVLAVKFNKAGVKQWERLFPVPNTHTGGKSIALDPAGNVFISGFTNWNPPADWQSRLLKLSPTGQVIWDKVGTGVTGSYWYDLAVSSLGEASVTGYINNGAGKVMRTSHFLANGTMAWSRDYSYPGLGGAVDQHGGHIEVDASNHIYVCGVHNNFPGSVYNTVAKYSRTSSQLWMRHFSMGERDYPRGFILGPGNVSRMAMETTLPNGTFGSSFVSYDTNGTETLRGFSPQPYAVSINSLAGSPEGDWIFAGYLANPAGKELYRVNSNGTSMVSYAEKNVEADVRALAMGVGSGDYYFATVPSGSGPRPATIFGDVTRSSGRVSQSDLWETQLHGSTANGQTPFAIVSKLVVDKFGDIFALGIFSGANAQDGLIVKYETGPIARSDIVLAQSETLLTSEPKGFLSNDHQLSQATIMVVTQPQHGVFSPQGDGSFTYQPNPGFAGNDSFVYRLTRTNGTVVRSSEVPSLIIVRPNLTGMNLTPRILQGGQTCTATITSAQAPNVEVGVNLSSSSPIPIDTFVQPKLAAGATTCTGFILTQAVGTAKTVVITAKSGLSTVTQTMTVTP